MKKFQDYIKIKESAYGSTGGIEPPKQNPAVIVSDYDGPIQGNYKASEKPIPRKKTFNYKTFRKYLFSLPN